MAKHVAVVTDAVSPEFYFPIWHRYYASQFGADNLHVVTFDTQVDSFRQFKLGSLISLQKYNNNLRAEFVNDVVKQLLTNHDVVIRVDTDEFLVPDPTYFGSLREYVESLTLGHVTAYGFNVIPDRNEPPLDLNRPILFFQRTIAQPADSLCKTCVTSKPIRWAPGFHFCSERPQFDKLFLFHTKLADIDLQVKIGSQVASFADETAFVEYHKVAREELQNRIQGMQGSERLHGVDAFYRKDYVKTFLDKISYLDHWGGIYHGGSYLPEPVLVEITAEFAEKF
jgi:hypothetical protein